MQRVLRSGTYLNTETYRGGECADDQDNSEDFEYDLTRSSFILPSALTLLQTCTGGKKTCYQLLQGCLTCPTLLSGLIWPLSGTPIAQNQGDTNFGGSVLDHGSSSHNGLGPVGLTFYTG